MKVIENFNPLYGPSGNEGVRGIEGDQGDIGNTGIQGLRGPTGRKGLRGPRGNLGPSGIKGSKGLAGLKGKRGERGMKGDRGDKGDKGPRGIQGPRGPKGFIGPYGRRGDKGEKGIQGEQGEQGYNGYMSINYNNCKYTEWLEPKLKVRNKKKLSSVDGNFVDKYIITPVNDAKEQKYMRSFDVNKGNGEYSKGGKVYYGSNGLVWDQSEWKKIKCEPNKVAVEMNTKCFCDEENDKDKCKDALHIYCTHRLKCCDLKTYDKPEPVNMIKTRVFNGGAGGEKEERLINKIWITLKPLRFNKKIQDYPDGLFNTENVNGNLKILTSKKDDNNIIDYTNECESKFCSIPNQICTDAKVCLDKINEETECLKPPCWFNIPKPIDECNGECENLGQYCTKNKVCDMRKNKRCSNPPCWNDIPVLKKCPSSRCPYPNQQCILDFDKYNMSGYICKNEINKNNPNTTEQCLKPPCWHKTDNYTTNCEQKKCEIIGQKCGTPDNYTKICLDKKNNYCPDPPCWFPVNKLKCETKPIIDDDDFIKEFEDKCKILLNENDECQNKDIYNDETCKEKCDNLIKENRKNTIENECKILLNENDECQNKDVYNDETCRKKCNSLLDKREQIKKSSKLKSDKESERDELRKDDIKQYQINENGEYILNTELLKITNVKRCAKESIIDDNGNMVLDSQGNEIKIVKQPCIYHGNCNNIGDYCINDNKIQYECINSYRQLDNTTDMNLKRKCTKPPCWFPVGSSGGETFEKEYFLYNQLYEKNYKDDININIINGLKNNNDDVYNFTYEDKEGVIDFNKLYNFMQDNWYIFEANCIKKNTLFLWRLYTGNNNGEGEMNYYQFSLLMRKLRVEKFKYRDGKGRIIPNYMKDEIVDDIYKLYEPINYDNIGKNKINKAQEDSIKLIESGIEDI